MKRDTTDIAAFWGKISAGVAREVTSSLKGTIEKFNRDNLIYRSAGAKYKITLTKLENEESSSN